MLVYKCPKSILTYQSSYHTNENTYKFILVGDKRKIVLINYIHKIGKTIDTERKEKGKKMGRTEKILGWLWGLIFECFYTFFYEIELWRLIWNDFELASRPVIFVTISPDYSILFPFIKTQPNSIKVSTLQKLPNDHMLQILFG